MKKICLLAPVIIFVVAAPVWAVEPGATTNSLKLRTEKKATVSAQRQDNIQAKCDLAQSKINFRINQYEQSRDKHYSTFTGVRKRLGDMVTKLEGKGCDMTEVKTDLTKFDSLITDFGNAFRDFIGSMQNTRNYQCGSSQGKFVQSAQQSRTKLVTVRQKAAAMHEFFKSTIQPHLSQKMKECRPSPKPSAKPLSSPAVSAE